MKLERFGNDQKLKKTLIVGGIIVVIAAIGFVLFKSYALYKEEKTFNIINGKIGNFSSGDVVLSYTINGSVGTSAFPESSSGYEVNSVTCENGATASWDATNWGITNIVSNGATDIKCTVDFNTDYTKYLVSTSNACIYNDDICSESSISSGVTVVYKPDGSTSRTFKVLADDGNTLTLVDTSSIATKPWSDGTVTNSTGVLPTVADVAYALGYLESYTSGWKYVNDQTYWLSSHYYMNIYLYESYGRIYYKMGFKTEGAYRGGIQRSGVKARLLSVDDIAPEDQSFSESDVLSVKYSWLSNYGWTSSGTPSSGPYVADSSVSSSNSGATGTYAWSIDSSGLITYVSPTSNGYVHPVIEIDKAMLIK